GHFDVKLTTTTASGCSSTTTNSGYINVVTPTVNVNTLHGCVNAQIFPFPATPTVDAISSWAWTVNGATPSTSTLPNPGFSFPAQGVYSGTVTITTSGGCTATKNFS